MLLLCKRARQTVLSWGSQRQGGGDVGCRCQTQRPGSAVRPSLLCACCC